jgi:hypothetical protein
MQLRVLDAAEKLYNRDWNLYVTCRTPYRPRVNEIPRISGKSYGAIYEPKLYTGELPPGRDDDTELVKGSCHCGAMTYAAKVKSLEDIKPQLGGSALLPYGMLKLPLENTQFQMDETNLGEYTTEDGLIKVMFCRTCGVPAQSQNHGDKDSALLNLRTLDVEGLDEKWGMNI